ncbi:MAG TPA: L-histidine N(alpha)-methyltransferase, partial [Burkholderiales bacterium]|nr:L-histidine N(alpha)-methyltransferase [Burkholderiales bacterium]
FPGSTIGNFTPPEALEFLRGAARLLGPGGAVLVGVDLRKAKALLDAAYDDPQGVTAEFNLNLLARINRELGADFNLSRFRHQAFYDPVLGRIEMHLESAVRQSVTVAGQRFEFGEGETIHTENSYKYSVEEFQALAVRAGFRPTRVWTDAQTLFAVHALAA